MVVDKIGGSMFQNNSLKTEFNGNNMIQPDGSKRILVAWFQYSLNGGIGRFLNISRVLQMYGFTVEFLSLIGDKETQWPKLKGKILSFEEAYQQNWDAVMVPGAGEIDERLNLLKKLKDPRFGIRVQHILNDTSKFVRFAYVNQAFDPHIVVVNNFHWQLKDFRKFRGEAFHFLPGAVDTDLFFPSPFKQIPDKEGEINIGGFAGKNLEPILNALDSLPENFHLHLYGNIEENQREKVHSLITLGRLSYQKTCFGRELSYFYKNIDVFVCPEIHAGWSNPAAEAMACGVPCVISSAGTTSFAENLNTAMVVSKPESGEEIANAIERLIDDPTLFQGISLRAAERMRKYSWYVYSSRLLSIIFSPRINSYFRIPEYNLWGKWDPSLRLDGLKQLFENSKDATVLDLGAAEGVIASYFAKNECKLIHGFELVEDRVKVAQNILSKTPVVQFAFHQAKLITWNQFIEQFKSIVLPQYDIVLFLGLYHHLLKEKRLKILYGALEKSKSWFAIRTPESLAKADDIQNKIVKKGFQLAFEEKASPEENLGWLGIFKRVPEKIINKTG